MYSNKKHIELNRIADKIEYDLQRAQNNPEIISDLSVRIQSLADKLKNEEKNSKINSLIIRFNFFKRKIKDFADQRVTERNNTEKEMKLARLKTRKISEVESEGQDVSKDDFYKVQLSAMDNFILSTTDSLNSLKRQDAIIERANAQLVNVLKKIGVSGNLITNIERRFGKDRYVFIVIFIFFILFFVIAKFLFK